jgi:integrase/recombinase XerD
MARRKRNSTIPAPTDPMHVLLEQHLAWMQVRNFSEDTVVTRRAAIGYFIDWCHERGLVEPSEVTRPILERYQRWLYQHRKTNGQPLTFRTQHMRLRALKGWFRWLARENHMLHNPASELTLPKLESRLPKHVLNASEAEQVLHQPDVSTATGVRDRSILEAFYATGMRRMEIARLKLYDIDADRGTIMVRQGKGKKDRLIPIGERALAWIAKYLRESRPELVGGADDGTVFLTDMGEPFERFQLTNLVRDYLEKSKIGKTGGCHLFRHSMATLMLENGADIRVIQEMLGHASLSTTQLYTRVSINLLKQVYAATHPGANLRKPDATARERDAEAEAELLAALDAEAKEDEKDV